MASYNLRKLYQALNEDDLRRAAPFSNDFERPREVLLHPYSTNAERREALNLWMHRNQPCLFGAVAAGVNRLHYCLLDEEDLLDSDEHVAARIQDEVRRWKQRSLAPHPSFSIPAHGFILAATSRKLELARPDANLLAFAAKLRDLWGCKRETSPGVGEVYLETLYLREPDAERYVRFTFSVDFFAAQGDGRWWHDHRVPAGLAFTANSVGHMRRYRDWYEKRDNQIQWLVQTAMLTIAQAHPTPYGRATWLRDLIDGQPIVRSAGCPFKDVTRLKPALQDKDFTRYGGHLHTDHSIRSEFFHPEPDKPGSVKGKEWLADFAYLFDPANRDHYRFSAGEPVPATEVYEVVGRIEDFTDVVGPGPRERTAARARTAAAAEEIAASLRACREMALTLDELARMDVI